MINERSLYIEKLNSLGLDVAGRRAAEEYIAGTDIKAHGRPIPFSYIPLLLNSKDMEKLNRIVGKAQAILGKITRYYIENPDYRKIFGFSKDMERLICLPCSYEEIIPVGRYDIFLDENTGDYQVCEFNTDGTGGMSRDYEISREILRHFGDILGSVTEAVNCSATQIGSSSAGTPHTDEASTPQAESNDTPHRYCASAPQAENTNAEQTDGISTIPNDNTGASLSVNNTATNRDVYRLQPLPTIELMAQHLIDIYRTDSTAIEHANFAITDFREEGVFSDFNRFIAAFKKNGINARFTDIRDFMFDGQHLIDTTDGTIIHGIYRRLVTSVMLERFDECQELVKAVEAGAVVLMGHFRTSIAHSKMINVAMYHPATRAFLSASENAWIDAHIPATYPLDTGSITAEQLAQVTEDKNNWLIKPKEGFASHGVASGMDMTAGEWADLVKASMDTGALVQHFCKRTTMPVLSTAADAKIEPLPLMLGIYQACGEAVGCYSRAGAAGVIDFDHGGLCVTTMLVNKL